MGNNFKIHSMDEWGAAVKAMKEARDMMQLAADEMKKIVYDALTKSGFTGNIAETLMTAYERDVLSMVKEFIYEVDLFIAKNEKMVGNSDDLITKVGNRVKDMKVVATTSLERNIDVASTIEPKIELKNKIKFDKEKKYKDEFKKETK